MNRMHQRTSELFIRQKATSKKDSVGKASQSSEYEAAQAAAALMERPPEDAGMDSMARNNLVAAALFLQMPNATAREKKDESTMIASVMSKRQGSANKWNQFRAKADVVQPEQASAAQTEQIQPEGTAAQTAVSQNEQTQSEAVQATEQKELETAQPMTGESQTPQESTDANSQPAEESRSLKDEGFQAGIRGMSQQGDEQSQQASQEENQLQRDSHQQETQQ